MSSQIINITKLYKLLSLSEIEDFEKNYRYRTNTYFINENNENNGNDIILAIYVQVKRDKKNRYNCEKQLLTHYIEDEKLKKLVEDCEIECL